jgi:anthranilate phosphoribosyltransferase
MPGGTVNTFYVHPSDFGVPKAAPAALVGGDADQNAAIVRAVLAGAEGAPRDIVLVNAATALLIAGHAPRWPTAWRGPARQSTATGPRGRSLG